MFPRRFPNATAYVVRPFVHSARRHKKDHGTARDVACVPFNFPRHGVPRPFLCKPRRASWNHYVYIHFREIKVDKRPSRTVSLFIIISWIHNGVFSGDGGEGGMVWTAPCVGMNYLNPRWRCFCRLKEIGGKFTVHSPQVDSGVAQMPIKSTKTSRVMTYSGNLRGM